MKIKILGVVILAALIMAVAFSASAPAAPNTASATACPPQCPHPNRPKRLRRTIRKFTMRSIRCVMRENIWNTLPTISAATEWKHFGQRMKRFASSKSA